MKKIVLRKANQDKQASVFKSLVNFLESDPKEITRMSAEFGYLSTHAIRNWLVKKKIAHREVERVEKYIRRRSQRSLS